MIECLPKAMREGQKHPGHTASVGPTSRGKNRPWQERATRLGWSRDSSLGPTFPAWSGVLHTGVLVREVRFLKFDCIRGHPL